MLMGTDDIVISSPPMISGISTVCPAIRSSAAFRDARSGEPGA
jgi:hypothetical protein